MLMTQTPVSALQGQNITSSFTSRSKKSTSDRPDPAAQLQHSDSTDPASLGGSNVDRDTSYRTYFTPDSTSLMNGLVGTAPPGAMYVRALYDYEADDRTSLSFHEGDIIQVITQLESGWWDGVINGVRGWFPSNYCQIITSSDELPELDENGDTDQVEEEADDQDIYDESFDDDEGSDHDDIQGLPLEGTEGDRSRADFWIPQATPDGRLFYYNTMTGETSMELPLESPSSVSETGPRDRMNINVPDRTRPPPEMMARGLTQDEEDESDANSASELEGEALMNASRGSLVRCQPIYIQRFCYAVNHSHQVIVW
jgi:son of sevenless